MTRLYFVRHGPTHIKAMLGWSDRPADLSDTAMLTRLSDALPDNAVVVSSDLSRASATADAIQGHRRRLPDQFDLREIHFGDWELRKISEIEAEDPVRLRAYWDEPGHVRPPGGESWNEAADRVNTAVDALISDHPKGNLVIVAHFGTILTQLQRALDIDAYTAFGHRIDNLSLTEIHASEAGWTVARINHLL